VDQRKKEEGVVLKRGDSVGLEKCLVVLIPGGKGRVGCEKGKLTEGCR